MIPVYESHKKTIIAYFLVEFDHDCLICRSFHIEPKILPCSHIFCKECVLAMIYEMKGCCVICHKYFLQKVDSDINQLLKAGVAKLERIAEFVDGLCGVVWEFFNDDEGLMCLKKLSSIEISDLPIGERPNFPFCNAYYMTEDDFFSSEQNQIDNKKESQKEIKKKIDDICRYNKLIEKNSKNEVKVKSIIKNSVKINNLAEQKQFNEEKVQNIEKLDNRNENNSKNTAFIITELEKDKSAFREGNNNQNDSFENTREAGLLLENKANSTISEEIIQENLSERYDKKMYKNAFYQKENGQLYFLGPESLDKLRKKYKKYKELPDYIFLTNIIVRRFKKKQVYGNLFHLSDNKIIYLVEGDFEA
ncbi:hypothetical protein EDEG_01848 [Edhazardia aedis USNM 41457]|uniref:RING-type domain-containing protein n=1 Tax=Edhazardia aedis (strain USNM 41457) TaxID=1003232 RepID=J9D8K1_EDHAE|nr:hypothetical protein EDEG_01848 [Edhazardia aedis USNM 41457]|eukprot:EJW03849.1 hypothetical protein EDEG_01848 [Edhazardia aedis USNM 41457]